MNCGQYYILFLVLLLYSFVYINPRIQCDQVLVDQFVEKKGGGFFFLSIDNRFIFKLITKQEHKNLMKLLPHYVHYMTLNYPDTYLCRILGCYSLTMNGHKKYILLMENMMHDSRSGTQSREIHQKFDLKGATLDLKPPPSNKIWPPITKTQCAVGEECCVGDEMKNTMTQSLNKDMEFLHQQNIVGYSLLIGVHDVSESNSPADNTV